MMAGRSWMRIVKDLMEGLTFGETYVQEWIATDNSRGLKIFRVVEKF